MFSPVRLCRRTPGAYLRCAGLARIDSDRADGASPRRRSIRGRRRHGNPMMVRLHKNATTTPAIRAEIQAAPASVSDNALALKYGRNPGTIKRWRRRTTVEDASHRPKQIKATLSPEMEEVVVELRRMLLLGIDDLLVVVREFICPTMSRSALDRMLRRHGVSKLGDLLPQEEPEARKRFKSYEPGFLHVDIKYLPRMPDEEKRKYECRSLCSLHALYCGRNLHLHLGRPHGTHWDSPSRRRNPDQ